MTACDWVWRAFEGAKHIKWKYWKDFSATASHTAAKYWVTCLIRRVNFAWHKGCWSFYLCEEGRWSALCLGGTATCSISPVLSSPDGIASPNSSPRSSNDLACGFSTSYVSSNSVWWKIGCMDCRLTRSVVNACWSISTSSRHSSWGVLLKALQPILNINSIQDSQTKIIQNAMQEHTVSLQ